MKFSNILKHSYIVFIQKFYIFTIIFKNFYIFYILLMFF